jgi:hypothetical protein
LYDSITAALLDLLAEDHARDAQGGGSFRLAIAQLTLAHLPNRQCWLRPIDVLSVSDYTILLFFWHRVASECRHDEDVEGKA